MEHASGGRWERAELQRLLDTLRSADVLVVWKLDRLSRSLRDLLTLLDRLKMVEGDFRLLTEQIDTTRRSGSCCRCSELLQRSSARCIREGLAAARRRPHRRPQTQAL